MKWLGIHLAIVVAATLVLLFHPRRPTTSPPGDALAVDWEGLPSIPSVFWIDGRTAEDFRSGHLPGAINLNPDQWDRQFIDLLDSWDGIQPIVVYCSNSACSDSRSLVVRLRRDLAFSEVYYLNGGWNTVRLHLLEPQP